jgi:putative ABC transport system permease protein
MLNLLRFIGIRNLRRKPLRTFLTTLGVCLGIALFVAVQIINRSTRSSFDENFQSIAGKASLVVTAGEAGLPEDRIEVVARTAGVRQAVPLVEGRTYLLSADGSTETLHVLGIDLLKEQSIRSYRTADDHLIDDPLIFLNQPDSIIITRALAQRRSLGLERSLDLLTSRKTARFVVRGVLSADGPALAYGGALAIMDIDAARLTFGKEGRVDRIDVIVDDGASVDAVAARLRTTLRGGYQVERPSDQSAAMARMVESYQLMMSFFSTLALVVGLFLVVSSANVSVVERRRELGILRALGAARTGILALFLGEAAILGGIGGFFGVWLGRGLAALMLPGALHGLSAQIFTKIAVHRLQFGARDVLQAILVGAVASTAAALWPAHTATRIQPVEAMRNQEVGANAGAARGSYTFRIGGGLLLWLLVSSAFTRGTPHPALDNLNQISAIVGAALIGPSLVLLLVRLLQRIVAAVGANLMIFRLAGDNLLRNPRRTAGNVMTLMIGLVLVMIIASVAGSVETTMVGWMGRILHADLFVSSSASMASVDVQPLHEDFGKDLALVPGVRVTNGRGAYAIRFVHVQYQGQQLGLKAFDEPSPSTGLAIFDVLDRPAAAAARDLFSSRHPTVMVSESFVRHFKKKTGDTIELETPSGPLRAEIVGVMVDFVSNVGVFYLNRSLYKQHWSDPLVSGFGLELEPGADPDAVRRDIDRLYGRQMKLVIASSAELKAELLGMIRKGFANTDAIELAALVVGLTGMLNTLLISVMERRREIGMLRAIGMSRRQVTRMILGEAMIQGGLGAVVAVAMGTWIASLWIRTSLTSILGLKVDFHFPRESIVTTVLIGLLVAAMAGLYPSRRAARIQIKEALDYD